MSPNPGSNELADDQEAQTESTEAISAKPHSIDADAVVAAFHADPRSGCGVYEVLDVRCAEPRSMDMTACPVCGHLRGRALFQLSGVSNPVLQCLNCHTARLPRRTSAVDAELLPAAGPGQKSGVFSRVSKALDRLRTGRQFRQLNRLIPESAQVLNLAEPENPLADRLSRAGMDVHSLPAPNRNGSEDSRGDTPVSTKVLREAGFEDQSFDLVLVDVLLHESDQPSQMLSELYQLVKPGGVLQVVIRNLGSWQARICGPSWSLLRKPRQRNLLPLVSAERMLHDSGFSIRTEEHADVRMSVSEWMKSFENYCTNWFTLAKEQDERLDEISVRGPVQAVFVLPNWLRLVLMLPAIPISFFASVCRSSDVVHLIAVRR